MANFKNKFNLYEIKGIFSCIIGKDSLDLSDLIMKNFRKQGDEYEIKLIIPKWFIVLSFHLSIIWFPSSNFAQ